MAEGLGFVEGLGPVGAEFLVVDVRRRCGQTVLVEDSAHILRLMIKQAGKLDFAIADSRDFGQSPFEVFLHEIANGIQLDADLVELAVVVGGPTGTTADDGAGGDGGEEGAAIHVQSSPFFMSPTA